MHRSSVTVVIAIALLLPGCAGTPEATNGTDTTTTSSTSSTTTAVPVEVPLAIWSGDSPEADTPESAASAAVRALHGITPVLGEFMAGDQRSGEMIVFSPGDTQPTERSLLLLRQLGSDDHWSVLAAISAGAVIDTPLAGSTHPAGTLVVEGSARGFEATVIVSAHRIGPVIELLDEQLTAGGSMEALETFRVELDLSAAQPGDVIAVMVRGGVGLEDDPGEFSAVAIRVGTG